ncbi:MAG: hypothetical protein IKF64_02270 [Eubacterium sp.]|nr:hypothetical protein [Eubacterium sp.]
MADFSCSIKAQLQRVGRPITVIDKNGGEEIIFAVVQQSWRRNKTNFEDKAEKPGRVYNEYCEIICPFDFDIKGCDRSTVFVIDGDRYELCRSEAVKAFGRIQFCRGIIKRIWEADENVFN